MKHLIFDKRLSKAKLFSVEISKSNYYAKFRLANAIRWQVGRICIIHRMPWLKESAVKIHPHLFKEQ